MSKLTINYDRKYDILYVDAPSDEPTYGEENGNGLVTFLGAETDSVLGFLLEDFKKRFLGNTIDENSLPLRFNLNDPAILSIISDNSRDYKATISVQT